MLLATGEHQSATLMSMALHALGVEAITLSGPRPASRPTAATARPASRASSRPASGELDEGKVVIVAGFRG